MKKLVVLFALLLASISAIEAQVTVPATYSYTAKVFGRGISKGQVKSYFLFTGGNEVIWCIESHDYYIIPIGFGTYNRAKSTLTFSNTSERNKLILDWDSPIVFKIKNINGKVNLIPTTSYDTRVFGESTKWELSKEGYTLKPNNKLAGKGFRYNYDNVYFISSTEAIVNGEKRGYICIDSTLGMVTGDNWGDECLVGSVGYTELILHRSGIEEKEFPTLTFDLIE